ncbi:unnamed protein product [Rotaria sp. Silwood1]|nr:unnamed protein product [Rotaria sp. Silwood1]CAF1269545.1 unnamed protein product [Rotaria sp. Silwood1]
MKLPSSTSVVYFTVYSILFLLSIILHFILLSFISSPLCRTYVIDFCITCILFFIGNHFFSWNNLQDLHWPLVPLICSFYFNFTLNSFEFLSMKCLPLILLIFLWSFHLIWQTLLSSNNIKNEDWRYEMMRQQYKDNFLVFAFFALYLLPMFEVLIGSSSIYYIYTNIHIYEKNIADTQLTAFRRHKQTSKEHRFAVLSNGLWKYSRHPNYLGEIIFWWGLFFLGYTYNAPLWCGLGPLLITLMMIYGSIPMTEDRLFRKYPDYKFVQQRISMLIPTYGF